MTGLLSRIDGFDQALGVVGGGRANHFQAGRVHEPHLRILRMEWAAVNIAAAGAANHQRRGRAPAIVSLGDHVDDLVEGAADEIHELELGHRTHAGERGAEGRAHDGGFRDGRVDDALGAEAVDEAVGDFERAAVDADVFAEAEDGGIALHFLPDSLADGFEIGELAWHVRSVIITADCSSFRPDATSNALPLRLLRTLAAVPVFDFRHAVLRLDLVAAILAIHTAGGGFRFRHRAGDCEIAVGFQLLIDTRDQFSVLSSASATFLRSPDNFRSGRCGSRLRQYSNSGLGT